jgi:hypothetical protein
MNGWTLQWQIIDLQREQFILLFIFHEQTRPLTPQQSQAASWRHAMPAMMLCVIVRASCCRPLFSRRTQQSQKKRADAICPSAALPATTTRHTFAINLIATYTHFAWTVATKCLRNPSNACHCTG